MSAKKMFEKLGYSWKEENSYISFTKVYWKHWVFQSKITIWFWKPLQKISIYDKEYIDLTLEELQAINKQMEELGWLND